MQQYFLLNLKFEPHPVHVDKSKIYCPEKNEHHALVYNNIRTLRVRKREPFKRNRVKYYYEILYTIYINTTATTVRVC